MINQALVKLARSKVGFIKRSFQPPSPDPSQDPSQQGSDPSQGGQMPQGMDPSMMQQPPMDPSQQGDQPMMPPQDPTMAAGASPVSGGGGLTADTIRQIMQETLSSLGIQQGNGPGAAGGQKQGKPDLMAMSMDIFQIKKMMSTLFNAMGISLPTELLDGMNRDRTTGASVPPNTPGSTSDMSADQPAQQQPNSSIKPISSIQGAMPTGGGSSPMSGGTEKSSAQTLGSALQTNAKNVMNKASALNHVLRKKSVR